MRGPSTARGDLADCRMEPLGVVVVAPPWNFPLSIPAGGVLAALAAGNAVDPEAGPRSGAGRLASGPGAVGRRHSARGAAFLPSADGEVGRALITDPRVDAVILTGSAETARLFLDVAAGPALFAETSGKNAMIITALADRDQAIRDLVRSAFGHDGQKCSAASLAICEAEVYDDRAFRRQLRDAAASLPVGSAWDPASRITPLTQPPGDALRRALTTLDEGEAWLLEPRRLGGDEPLWSPGIKLGVRRGSFFHRTECFGPVLGLMRAETLDEAIDLANDTPFGLTSGIQSLDEREVDRWVERLEAGNLYVNRPITGAIVRRQPFGGWKASSVGPGAKAGGPNYVLQLARWQQVALPAGGAECAPRVAAVLRRCLEEWAMMPRRRPSCWRARPATRPPGQPLRMRARPERSSRRRQRVPLPPVPRDIARANHPTSRNGPRSCRSCSPRSPPRAADPEPPRGELWPWLSEQGHITAVIESEAARSSACAPPASSVCAHSRRSHSTCGRPRIRRG